MECYFILMYGFLQKINEVKSINKLIVVGCVQCYVNKSIRCSVIFNYKRLKKDGYLLTYID